MNWNFDNTYSRLPEKFYTKQLPIPVCNPSLVIFNYPLAVELGLINSTTATEAINLATLAGNNLPPGAAPLAQAYAGHQFGHFTRMGTIESRYRSSNCRNEQGIIKTNPINFGTTTTRYFFM